MKILVAGASGFIGGALVSSLKKQHQVTILGRHFHNDALSMNWKNLSSVDSYDVVINLAGENIGEKRWTTGRKKNIVMSRVNATSILANLCAAAREPKPRLLNASAVGIYGVQQPKPDKPTPVFDDYSVVNFSVSPDFLTEVATAWERAAAPAVAAGCDVTWARFGVVLDASGGALKKMLPAFKLGFGGKIGAGDQPFAWITRHDAVRAIQFIIDENITGPVCVVAPAQVTQYQFAKSLAKFLHRPCFFSMPGWLVRFIFGQMGDELLLSGQLVKPRRLEQLGFVFDAPTIEEGIRQAFSGLAI